MKLRKWLAGTFAGAALAAGPATLAADPKPADKPLYTFAALKAMPADAAKGRLEAALRAAGKLESAKFEATWAKAGRSVADRVVEAVADAYPEAAAALAEARAFGVIPGTDVPAVLKDDKLDPFVRANLAAAYSKALAGKKAYEEALEAAKGVRAELLADPAGYYFYKAVCEHGLGVVKPEFREAGMASVTRLLDDVADTPDRYRMVATLMFFDMQAWSKDPKDLANIGRLMDNSERRLELARAGTKTQDIQKRIVFRLDEKIKELEKKSQGGGGGGGGGGNDGQCPSGGSSGGAQGGQANAPASDSYNGGVTGPGNVDEKKLRQYAEVWGKLPEAERAKAVQEITRDLPPKFKPMIEEYFKALNRMHGYK